MSESPAATVGVIGPIAAPPRMASAAVVLEPTLGDARRGRVGRRASAPASTATRTITEIFMAEEGIVFLKPLAAAARRRLL